MSSDVLEVQEALSGLMPAQMPVGLDERDVNIRHYIRKLHAATSPFKIANVVENSSETAPGEIHTSGEWEEPETRKRGCDVKMVFYLNPATKRLRWTESQWDRRRTVYYQMLMHELIHRHQPSANGLAKTRKYRPTAVSAWSAERQEYHGSVDEIEAYAHDAALEYFIHWPEGSYRDVTRAAFELRDLPSPPTTVTFTKVFENDPTHAALKHFYRKTRAWFDFMNSRPDFYLNLELSRVFP